MRNRAIGERLGITVPTVKDHVHHILDKTGLTSRAAVAVAYALREA
ncbi:MAG: LuxR C-terminal-related transcriptional regulator [Myxococcota bacterium]